MIKTMTPTDIFMLFDEDDSGYQFLSYLFVCTVYYMKILNYFYFSCSV